MSTQTSLHEAIDLAIATYAQSHRFMGSVLIGGSKNLLYHRAHGWANMEWDVRNTIDTKFRIGCLTMQFTATAIMLLAQQGKIDVNLPAAHYTDAIPPLWKQVTVLDLLTCCSGIPCYTRHPSYSTVKLTPNTPVEILTRLRDIPLLSDPGTELRESHTDYLILGHLIERISGRHYDEWVSSHILKPLKMTDTRFDSNSAIIEKRASGYVFGAKRTVNASYLHASVPFSTGGFLSTCEDIWKYLRGIFESPLLTEEIRQTMLTPRINNTAFGWGIYQDLHRRVVEHGGVIDGFGSHFTYYPVEKLSVIILSNYKGVPLPKMAREFARLALNLES